MINRGDTYRDILIQIYKDLVDVEKNGDLHLFSERMSGIGDDIVHSMNQYGDGLVLDKEMDG